MLLDPPLQIGGASRVKLPVAQQQDVDVVMHAA
jgi:hypothetical protein